MSKATEAKDRKSRTIASPRAQRAIARLGIDAHVIQGSGPNGRIVEADVLGAGSRPKAVHSKGIQRTEATSMRKAIASMTSESFATIPHFYLRTEIDAEPLVDLRTQILGQFERDFGVRPTLTDLILRAMALALRDNPKMNRIWQDGYIVGFPTVDVGLVVSLDGGLLIPVIRQADQLGLAELAGKRAELVEAARQGKLTPQETSCGATSLSNLGASCVDEFSAIISPTQSSMLAVGRAAARPFVIDGEIRVRTTMHLCLSADHRVIDGGPASLFLGRIVELLENPEPLLYEGAQE